MIALNEVFKELLPEDEEIQDIIGYNKIKGIKETVQSVLKSIEGKHVHKDLRFFFYLSFVPFHLKRMPACCECFTGFHKTVESFPQFP